MTQTVKHNGIVLIITMVILAVISVLALSLAAVSATSLKVTENNHSANSALSAAQSGIEYAKYFVADINTLRTADNEVNNNEATSTWLSLCQHLQNSHIGGVSVSQSGRFTDPCGSGDETITNPINFGTQANFSLRFCRYDSLPEEIKVYSVGTDGAMSRTIRMEMQITKKADVLQYAIASISRMWLTGNSTIHGNIYSSWKYQSASPFNMSSDSTVEGTINTILSNINPTTGQPGPDLYAGTTKMPYDLETLDASGNPVYDSSGNKVISSTDEIQGQCYGINYGVNYGNKAADMPGMKITDYDTSQYKSQTTALSTTGIPTVTEYFPHAAGNYGQPSSSGSQKLTRYEYQGQTYTNTMVSAYSISHSVLKSTLFKDCTFNGILYLDCGATGSTYNNVRFENCVFNGPIITNTPNYSNSTNWWMKNCLYFTGEETFQNQTDVPATILAPNFNVNLGNTNPNSGENNVLTGAIVGGIVDIRGNAEVFGTIISMFDTSIYSSGYVSNIGATLDDGGSETTEPGDVGVINITPDPSKLLPSGVTTPIAIKPLQYTYREIHN
jgi:type II secretory pathway pseudopilin PulG